MKIALNTYSLRKEWALMTMGSNYKPVIKFIKMLDGIDEVELLDRSFDSDPQKLEEIQKIFHENDIEIFSLGPHPKPLTNENNWAKTIKELNYWTDICADHGIHNYRLSLGGGHFPGLGFKLGSRSFGLGSGKRPENTDQAVEWAVKVLGPATEYAEQKDVNLCIETHHKYSSNPEFQEKLLTKLPVKNLGFIFDIGNYENDELRWKSLDVLIRKKSVKYVHAKAYKFDENGLETTLDYPRAVKLLQDAGFDINLSIEWEGRMAGPIGAIKTYELCLYSIAKSQGNDYKIKTDFPDEDTFMEELLED